MNGECQTRKGITFQCGLARASYGFEGRDLTGLKELACSFLEQKFPDHGYVAIADKIVLFVEEKSSNSDVLKRLDNIEQLKDGSVILVVLSATVPEDETVIRPHTLQVHSYKSPTFCDFCGQMLFGLVRQGLKCEGCGGNFHKRCAYKLPNNCSDSKARNYAKPRALSVQLQKPPHPESALSHHQQWKRRTATWGGWQQVPHTFEVHSYKRPTNCQICKRLLRGLFKQGVQCKDCKFNCHSKCAAQAPKNCPGDVTTMETGSYMSLDSGNDSFNSFGEMEQFNEWQEDEIENDVRKHSGEEVEAASANSPEGEGEGPSLSHTSSTNISLRRVIQSVKHTKMKGAKVLNQGYMVHFTNKDSQRKRHFWRLDTKFLTLYQDSTSSKFFKEIPLSEILEVDTSIDPLSVEASRPPHCFEMKTRTMIYYIGQSDPLEGEELPDADSGVGSNLGKTWADTIRSALTPCCVTPTTSATSGRTMSSEEDMDITLDDLRPRESQPDISHLYQIFPDDVLGAGQFGIVYGGVHRESGREVAIKIIDKSRFPTKQEAQLKNEYSILQHVKHPGVVILEQMFETPERVFVVMEKLRGDMLEMILSQPMGRLEERCTKFLVTQILVALRHLHAQNIVHCDLKPENVLLTNYTADHMYPQVKLCDFGFARIIEESKFRGSVVGTPAYVAPEVLLNKGYNRSLDMWSVGVIIYVSLSGTFPFNEDEDIQDQIHNAAFMYPPDPWSEISNDAIKLISNLLQVNQGRRYTVDKSLIHPWLQDYLTWTDLRKLEKVLNKRYLTNEEDDHKWQQIGKQVYANNTEHEPHRSSNGAVNKYLPHLKTTISSV